ncbi:MAG: SecDF P1 head subdomain-containing protein [Aquaticitalea sp.]
MLYEFENNTRLSEAERNETVQILNKRLEKFSSDFEVSLTNDKKIKILTKTSFDENRVHNLITNQGKLEFWEIYKSEEFYSFIVEADKIIQEEVSKDSVATQSLLDLVSPAMYPNSPILFYAKTKDTAFISASYTKQHIRNLLPVDYKYTKFLWGQEDEDNGLPLYAIKSNREDKATITGENVTFAKQGYNTIERPTVSITMDELGANRWERMTGRAYREQTCIAVTLNDIVYSAPGVAFGPIHGGNSEISGNFTVEEAQDLATILSASKLIHKLKLLQSSVVGD